jgi:hypothetical protein
VCAVGDHMVLVGGVHDSNVDDGAPATEHLLWVAVNELHCTCSLGNVSLRVCRSGAR